jgi:hypothetical protein
MAANPVKPFVPKPPALPRGLAPAAASGSQLIADDSWDVQVDAPIVTASELADLRARLARAEARVKELEARPAIAPPASSNPFLEGAPLPPPKPTVQAVPSPAPTASVHTQVAQVAPAAPPVAFAPSASTSIMPFDGAKRKRRLAVALVSMTLLAVAGLITVSIVSQTVR